MCARPPATGSQAPQGTFLHELVAAEFPDYFADRTRRGREIPDFVVRDFQQFLACGDIRSGYATLECIKCITQVDICLRCKRRGWCPHCMRFRQLDRADFIEHRVIGGTPVRQWTLTMPPPLRINLAFNPHLVSKVLRRHLENIFQYLRRVAKSLLRSSNTTFHHVEAGSVTVIQRFSTDLTLNLHFHSLVTDGVFVKLTPDGPMIFLRLPQPSAEDIAAVAAETCRWTRELLIRAGAWQDVHDVSPCPLDTVCGYLSLGPETPRTYRFCGVAAKRETDGPVHRDGAYAFNLHVGDSVSQAHRTYLRQMIEYILSPPFTDAQLRQDPDSSDHVLLDLKRQSLDGTLTLRLSKHQFLDRLVWITPRPNANLIRFHGVYAPNYRYRSEVVPSSSPPATAPPDNDENADDYRAWGEFLTHTYPQDVMRCPRCRGRMKLVALKSDRINYRRQSGIPPDDLAGAEQSSMDLPEAA